MTRKDKVSLKLKENNEFKSNYRKKSIKIVFKLKMLKIKKNKKLVEKVENQIFNMEKNVLCSYVSLYM